MKIVKANKNYDINSFITIQENDLFLVLEKNKTKAVLLYENGGIVEFKINFYNDLFTHISDIELKDIFSRAL